MTAFVALLRAVDVGGTGTLPMAGLRAMCGRAGARVATDIASDNAVLAADMTEDGVAAALGARLDACAGRPVGVLARTAAEMAGGLARNPRSPSPRPTARWRSSCPRLLPTMRWPACGTGPPRRWGSAREVCVACGDTTGRSRLVVPAAEGGTARNMSTLAALARTAGGLRDPALASSVCAARSCASHGPCGSLVGLGRATPRRIPPSDATSSRRLARPIGRWGVTTPTSSTQSDAGRPSDAARPRRHALDGRGA